MVKTIAIIVLALAVIIIAIADYRLQVKYNKLRIDSMETRQNLRELVCYVHNKGWEDRAWGGRLPSHERTERPAEKLYKQYIKTEETSD